MTQNETKTLFSQMDGFTGLMARIYIWLALTIRYPNAGKEWIWK